LSNISAPLNIPVGGTVTFTVTGTIALNATGNIVNTATITAPSGVTDPNGANNSATDTDALVPTAAGVTVGGRVVDQNGRGLRGVQVSITDSHGIRRNVMTTSLGFYQFDDVQSGDTYVIGASSKMYRFSSRILQITDNVSSLDFVGQD